MTIKKCFPLLLILSFLFLSSFAFALDEEYEYLSNPQISPRREFEECQRKCEDQKFRGQQRQLCAQRCEQRFREREERERREHHRGHGGDDDVAEQNPRDWARETYQQCQQGCDRSHQSQQQTCRRQCQQQYEEDVRREKQEREHGHGGRRSEEEAREKFEQCKEGCEWSHQQQQSCQRQCQQQFDEDVRREKQEREHGHGGRNPDRKDPEGKFRECRSRCAERKHEQGPIRECEQECESRYREDQGRRGMWKWEEEEEEEERMTLNPYHFTSQNMRSRFRTDEGHLMVLDKFSLTSKLLKGLENYRIVVLEAAPNTFLVPHHCDADSLLVVTKGKGTITIVRQNNKESFNMESSDVVLARAGSILYLVNQDNNERLQITKLVTPVNVPGQFEEYFPAGGDIQQSYFKAFSTNILKQSLSATEEQIEKLVGQQRSGRRQGQGQRQGILMRASQEQLKALTQHATSPKRKGGRDSTGPISLRNMSPLYSNNFGKFFEADPDQHKQLQEMDVFVNWAELKQGAIMVPHYNSKATVVVKVVEGTGRFEMACPHLERQQQQQKQKWSREEHQEEETTGRFQKVSSRLSPGDVFIIPAGHPVAVEASQGQTLKMVGFGVNARNNDRIFIAGKENMIKQLEREAKELAFNMPGREVEEIFNQPKLSYFVPKESSREEGHRSHPLDSILNFAGFV